MKRRKPRILVAGIDSYLAVQIARHVPGAEITSDGSRPADLAVLESGDNEAAVLVRNGSPRAVLALADAPHHLPERYTRALVRPFLPGAVLEAIDDMLDAPAMPPVRPRLLGAAARLAALALGAGLEELGGTSGAGRIIAGVAIAYGIGRLLAVRSTKLERFGPWLDVAAACALVVPSGGPRSGYAAFAAIAAVGAGYRLGWSWGTFAGAAISLATGAAAAGDLIHTSAGAGPAVAWLALFPLAGMAGGHVARVRPRDEAGDLLSEANRVLTELHAITRAMPGSLDTATIALAVRDDLRNVADVSSAVVFALDDDGMLARSSFGIDRQPDGEPVGLLETPEARAVELAREDPALAAALGRPGCWLVVPAVRGGRSHGVLLAACAGHARHRRTLASMRKIAGEMAVAMENADLFRRVRLAAAGDERRRIAHQMHEGLAQSLTHLRLEMDFIVRHGIKDPTTMRTHLGQMSSVLDRAVVDVRSLMNELRTARPTGEAEPPTLERRLA